MNRQGRVGLYNRGLWRLRRDVAAVTGLTPVRRLLTARGLTAIAGWGHKPTANHARTVARRNGLTYLALEEGFICGRPPGSAMPSLSYVCDPVGIYYEAARPSQLEALIMSRARDPRSAAADAALIRDLIGKWGISKYTPLSDAPTPPRPCPVSDEPAILVVDQTVGDAAVSGAGADADTFTAMLAAAVNENPDRRILIKTHPETARGRRHGYFSRAGFSRACAANPDIKAAWTADRIAVLDAPVTPRDLAPSVTQAYVVSSLLGLELLLLGVPVTAFGQSFYSGWGLTDDRAPPTGRRQTVPLDCLVAGVYLDYPVYISQGDRRPHTAIDALAQMTGTV